MSKKGLSRLGKVVSTSGEVVNLQTARANCAGFGHGQRFNYLMKSSLNALISGIKYQFKLGQRFYKKEVTKRHRFDGLDISKWIFFI